MNRCVDKSVMFVNFWLYLDPAEWTSLRQVWLWKRKAQWSWERLFNICPIKILFLYPKKLFYFIISYQLSYARIETQLLTVQLDNWFYA